MVFPGAGYIAAHLWIIRLRVENWHVQPIIGGAVLGEEKCSAPICTDSADLKATTDWRGGARITAKASAKYRDIRAAVEMKFLEWGEAKAGPPAARKGDNFIWWGSNRRSLRFAAR